MHVVIYMRASGCFYRVYVQHLLQDEVSPRHKVLQCIFCNTELCWRYVSLVLPRLLLSSEICMNGDYRRWPRVWLHETNTMYTVLQIITLLKLWNFCFIVMDHTASCTESSASRLSTALRTWRERLDCSWCCLMHRKLYGRRGIRIRLRSYDALHCEIW